MKTANINCVLLVVACMSIGGALILSSEIKSKYISILMSKGLKIVRIMKDSDQSGVGQYHHGWPSDTGVNAHTSVQFFQYMLESTNISRGAHEQLNKSYLADGWHTKDSKTLPLTENSVVWTIAKNVPKNMPDNLPVLMTRNVDVSSLGNNVSSNDMQKKVVYLDNRYRNSFDRSFALIVYADGHVEFFKLFRQKFITYRAFYRDCELNVAGLKYLTPREEISLVAGGTE
jgi:hypothetical protein